MTAEGLMPSENSGAAVMKIALCLHRIPHPVRDPYPDSGSIETEAQRGASAPTLDQQMSLQCPAKSSHEEGKDGSFSLRLSAIRG